MARTLSPFAATLLGIAAAPVRDRTCRRSRIAFLDRRAREHRTSTVRDPSYLGLHLRRVYPGSHRGRGITFRRAELGTAGEAGRRSHLPDAGSPRRHRQPHTTNVDEGAGFPIPYPILSARIRF